MSEPSCDIFAIGNAIVDVIAPASDSFLREERLAKGGMQLIGAERAEQLYSRMGPARELSGGSAANTIAGLAILGHKCTFAGQIAADQLGSVFAHDIRAAGVDFAVPPMANGTPTAHSLILVTPDGQRTMNTFLGASQHLAVAAIQPDKVAGARILFLEGYLWESPNARAAMQYAIGIAKGAGRLVALSLSDAGLVERHRAEFLTLLQDGKVDILFANRPEAMAFSERATLEEAVEHLSTLVPVLVTTDGENGARCFAGDQSAEVGGDPDASVVDTTGAGDLFAAGFLSGFLNARSIEQCLRIGTICATEVISHFGPRPEADLAQLIQEKMQ